MSVTLCMLSLFVCLASLCFFASGSDVVDLSLLPCVCSCTSAGLSTFPSDFFLCGAAPCRGLAQDGSNSVKPNSEALFGVAAWPAPEGA